MSRLQKRQKGKEKNTEVRSVVYTMCKRTPTPTPAAFPEEKFQGQERGESKRIVMGKGSRRDKEEGGKLGLAVSLHLGIWPGASLIL